MKSLFLHFKHNFLLYLLIIFAGYLFFYHLDYSTVTSWDEGWYGSIARQILRTGDIFHLVWDGRPFYDHPPMGFWFMALAYRLFGINEFATRLPSAIVGVLTVILVYRSAVELFGKKVVGLAASLVLMTSVWYVIRVRSGNLDALFVFFYILTMYTSLRSSKDFRWFPVTMVSFGALVMTKTLVGVSAIVLILFLNIRQLIHVKKNFWNIVLGIILFGVIVLPWYAVQIAGNRDFIQHHFFTIGTRNKTLASYLRPMFEQPLFYLHMGVRKWYYLWFVGGAFLVGTFRFVKKNILFLFLWNIVILYPFLTSTQTELWHLIPVYLPLAFITAGGFYVGFDFFARLLRRMVPKRTSLISRIRYERLFALVYLLFFVTIAIVQFRVFRKEVFAQYRYMPDDVDISKKVARYGKKVFLDDDYLPLAVYYSGIDIQELRDKAADRNTLVKLFLSPEQDFVVITRNWAVDNLKTNMIPYRLLEKNNSFSILARP